MKTQKPRILDRRCPAQSRLFKIEELSLRFSNGVERQYERINPGYDRAVMIVPILNTDTLILIKEYGAGIEDYHLSFPKGAIDQGESILQAASRELQEEAGFAAHDMTHIKKVALSPNYMGNQINLVIARQLYPSQLAGDEPEPLEVVEWPLDNIAQLALDPRFIESYALAALAIIAAQQ